MDQEEEDQKSIVVAQSLEQFFTMYGITSEQAGRALAQLVATGHRQKEPKHPTSTPTTTTTNSRLGRDVAPQPCVCKLTTGINLEVMNKCTALTEETIRDLEPNSLLLVYHELYKKWRLARLVGYTPKHENLRYKLLMKTDLDAYNLGDGEETAEELFGEYAGRQRRLASSCLPACAARNGTPRRYVSELEHTGTIRCEQPWKHVYLVGPSLQQ